MRAEGARASRRWCRADQRVGVYRLAGGAAVAARAWPLPGTATGATSRAKRPAAIAAAARWCERTANSSCAPRAISLRRAMSSAASPMTCPVERSATFGARGSSSPGGQSWPSAPSTSDAVGLPNASGAAACTSFCGSLTSVLLVESEPPAMTRSASPRSIAPRPASSPAAPTRTRASRSSLRSRGRGALRATGRARSRGRRWARTRAGSRRPRSARRSRDAGPGSARGGRARRRRRARWCRGA